MKTSRPPLGRRIFGCFGGKIYPQLHLIGKRYWIKCIDATYAVELAADGAEEIDGSAVNVTLGEMESVMVQSDNANWWIV